MFQPFIFQMIIFHKRKSNTAVLPQVGVRVLLRVIFLVWNHALVRLVLFFLHTGYDIQTLVRSVARCDDRLIISPLISDNHSQLSNTIFTTCVTSKSELLYFVYLLWKKLVCKLIWTLRKFYQIFMDKLLTENLVKWSIYSNAE